PAVAHDAHRAAALRGRGPRARRLGRADHLHADGFDAHLGRGAGRRARLRKGALRRPLRARNAERLPLEEGRPGRPRGDPAGRDDDQPSEEEGEGQLPPLAEGDVLRLLELVPEQHFTQPPPRFTQATLIKELEENGIGRPSTYASIVGTILNKEYVVEDEQKR